MKMHIQTSKLQAQLAKLKGEVTTRLETTAKRFAIMVVVEATGKTPLGNSELNMDYYLQRQKETGLLPEEGIARGGWYVDTDGVLSMQTIYGRDSEDKAISFAKTSIQEYKLGDTIMIANRGPYIEKLEAGYSPQAPRGVGIVKPTLDAVMRLQAYNLDSYYKGT